MFRTALFFSALTLLSACDGPGYSYASQIAPYGSSSVSPYNNGNIYGSGTANGSFVSLQQQVLEPYCSACHATSLTGGGHFGVETYQDVMAPSQFIANFVVPGNPNASVLYQVVVSGQMPPATNGPLPAGLNQQLAQQIGNWIANGAPVD